MGVGDALRRIHSALRLGGLLLDLHPEPRSPEIEVRVAGRITAIGKLDSSSNAEKVLAARRVLASIVGDGLFVQGRATSFAFHYHFSGMDTWLDYMTERWTSAIIDPATVTRARELLQESPGELVIREQVHAARLHRPCP